MSSTIIGVFDAGRVGKVTAELRDAGFNDRDIEVVEGNEKQILAKIVERGFGEDDARGYAEEARRGRKLLAARGAESKIKRAVAIMERYETTNDNAEEQGETETVPVTEEELSVSKRRTIQGGVRVTSKVTERPVEETVRLREEQVEVERNAVDRKLSPEEADEAFQEKTIEMTETAEEAQVRKEARVVEEVALKKTAEEHEEKIKDKVRRTEVEVEELKPGSSKHR
jgi:stress response protein YsnF